MVDNRMSTLLTPTKAAKSRYITKRRGNRRSSAPTVRISGNTVTINGKGFSVAPSLQASFIQSRTGGRGSSAQSAMAIANKIEGERQKQEQLKRQELAKLEGLKLDVARSNLSRNEKIKFIGEINQQKKAVVFESKLKTGEVLGFSGTGLSPSQFAKREFLIKTGRFRESSSKDNIFRNLNPLLSSYFVDRSPSTSDKNNLVALLKSEQFNTARVNLPKEILNRGNQLVKNIKNNISQIRNDPSKAAFLSARIENDKNSLINNLKNFFGSRVNFTTRTATLLGLYIASTGINVLTTTGEIIISQDKIKKIKKASVAVGNFSKDTIKKTPQFVKNVYNDPELYASKGWTTTKNIGNAIKREGIVFGKLLATEPDAAVAMIGREIFIMVAVGGAFRIVGKVGSSSFNALKSAFNKVGRIGIPLKKIPASKYLIKGARKIEIAKINIEYKKSLNLAKKIRLKSAKKGKTLELTSPNYKQALNNIDSISDSIAKVKTYEFLISFTEKGGKITKGQLDELLNAVRNQYRNNLQKTVAYQTLQKLSLQDRFLSVKLIRQGKIKSAKILFNSSVKNIKSIPAIKLININLSNIKRGIKIKIKKIKAPVATKIKKFKTKIEIAKMRREAKKFRKKSKWKQSWFGDDRYEQVKIVLEEKIKLKSVNDVDKFLAAYKKSGKKIGLGKREEFIDLLTNKRLKAWRSTKEYKSLTNLSILNEKYMIEFRKKIRFESAKNIFDKSIGKIKQFKIPTSELRQRLRLKVRRVKRKIIRKIQIRKQKKFIKKTIRYRLEKKRPIRTVTFEQLQKTQNVTSMNNFIDKFFKELQLRQGLRVSTKTYSQMKNVLKKRMRNAIKTNNKQEIKHFGESIKKLMNDMNKKSNRPDIKVSEIVKDPKTNKPSRRIRTIKDFETPMPKGTYQEVKVGDTVLLQKVKTKQVQKAKVISVQKEIVSLAPIVKYASISLSMSALKNIQRSRQAFVPLTTQASLSKVLQGSGQDFTVLSDVAQASKQTLSPKIIQAVNSKSRTLLKQPVRQITKTKKKKPVIKIKKKERNTRKLSRKVMTYGFVIKKGGRVVKLNIPPMTLQDAWDVGSKKLDFDLQRTGKLIPLGKNNVVAKLSKGVGGYYKRNSKKFRRFRKKKGKIYSLERTIIEKKKYIGDTKSEIRQLKKSRKTKKKTAKKRKKK